MRTWPGDFINKIICGDCLELMKKMPGESIDMCLTSPPYWALRDYGTGPDQLGLEPTPDCGKQGLFRLKGNLTKAQREFVVQRLLDEGLF